MAWTAAALCAALAAAGWWKASTSQPSSSEWQLARFVLPLPSQAPMSLNLRLAGLAISRDGRAIAFIASPSGVPVLYLRRLDSLEAEQIRGTEHAESPFFSFDGQWLAFFADGKLKKVALSGGAPLAIADAPNDSSGVWAEDGSIIVGGGDGIARVAQNGGGRERLSSLEDGEIYHNFPDLLPDGKTVLYTIERGDVTSFDDARIAVQQIGGARRVVVEGGAYGRYAPSGHIVYARNGSIMAIAFDSRRLEVAGEPAPVVQGGMFNQLTGAADFALTEAGTLVYAPGGPIPFADMSIQWADRRGAIQATDTPPHSYVDSRVSPDGRLVAFGIQAANDDVWVYDPARNTFTRLTFTQGNSIGPVWSPEGLRVAYSRDRGPFSLYWRKADGSDAEERLVASENLLKPGSWSPDGKALAYTELRPGRGNNIRILSMDGARSTRDFIDTPYNEFAPSFSPDGHWIAYVSDETGQREVFVSLYPEPGKKWQVSSGGGASPQWTRGGKELLFRKGDRVMSVAIQTTPVFKPSAPRDLLGLPDRTREFAASPDGERLLLIHQNQELVAPELHVVLNWFEELKQRVPVP